MLNKNHIRVFEFDYENKTKEAISILSEFFFNLFIPLIAVVFTIFFDSTMLDERNVAINNVIKVVEVVFIIVLAGYMPIIAFLPKKVILYQNSIQVKRHNISGKYIRKGLDDNILYSSIISCRIYKGAHYSGWATPDYAVSFFNWDSLVEIVCEKNKKYYIPVKDADDFIAEVNARVEKIKFFRALNIDSLLKDKNGKTISYYDLKVRWKSSDKIDSVYYTDDEGNDIDIINY